MGGVKGSEKEMREQSLLREVKSATSTVNSFPCSQIVLSVTIIEVLCAGLAWEWVEGHRPK